MDALFAIRDIDERYGHVQEVIVPNFRAKADTQFAGRTEPSALDVARTAAVARLILAGDVDLQVPPNLSRDSYGFFLAFRGSTIGAGFHLSLQTSSIRKWLGRTSEILRAVTEDGGFTLRERLTAYPQIHLRLGLDAGEFAVRALAWLDDLCWYLARKRPHDGRCSARGSPCGARAKR